MLSTTGLDVLLFLLLLDHLSRRCSRSLPLGLHALAATCFLPLLLLFHWLLALERPALIVVAAYL